MIMNKFPLHVENFTSDSEVDKIKILSLDTQEAVLIYDDYILKEDDLPVVIPISDIKKGKLIYNPTGHIKNVQKLIEYYESSGLRFIKIENCYLYFSETGEDNSNDVNTIERLVNKSMRYADYLVLYYDFTNPQGFKDLDIETFIINKYDSNELLGFVPSKRNKDVAITESSNGYMKWSNDNRGNGVETVLFDLRKIRQDYPNFDVISFSVNCQWWQDSNIYEKDGLNPKVPYSPLKIKIVGYEGGKMELDNNYKWININGDKIGQFEFNPINISTDRPAVRLDNPNFNKDPKPYNIGIFTFNNITGEIKLTSDIVEDEKVINESDINDLIKIDGGFIFNDKYNDSINNICLDVPEEERKRETIKEIVINSGTCESNITYVLSYKDSVNYCDNPIQLQIVTGSGDSLSPNWKLTGRSICSKYQDEVVPTHTLPIYKEDGHICADSKDEYESSDITESEINIDCVVSKGEKTYYFEEQRDTNPNSMTFNKLRWIRNKDKDHLCNI